VTFPAFCPLCGGDLYANENDELAVCLSCSVFVDHIETLTLPQRRRFELAQAKELAVRRELL